jgi:MATE family multidrug resistance protein
MVRFERLKREAVVRRARRGLRRGGARLLRAGRELAAGWSRPAGTSDAAEDGSRAGLRRGEQLGRWSATLRELCDLAWPIAAAMLGTTAMGIVDTKLVAGLGAHALGGVGMATVLMYLGYSMVFGLMRGVKVRTAHATGEGRPHDGVRYAQAGALLGVAAGTVLWAVSRDATVVLQLLGIHADTIPFARDFLSACTWGAPACCAMAALIQHRQGLGDARTPMLVGLFGNVHNAVLAYGLIYGRWGLPALGVRGAGFATAATELLQLCVLLWLLRRQARASQPALALGAAAREVAGLGVPTGLHFGFEMLAFTAFTALLGAMGAAELAAHHLALNVLRASFLPGVAIAEAASVLVGRALGRRRLVEADRVARAALGLAVSFMALCGLAFAAFGDHIARAFTSDAEVVAVAARLLLVAAGFQALDAAYIVLRSSLRGAQEVRWVAVVGTTIAWCTIPGAALLLGRLAGWGALGGWCGFVLETAIGSALLWRRWTRGRWRRAFEAPVRADPVVALAA